LFRLLFGTRVHFWTFLGKEQARPKNTTDTKTFLLFVQALTKKAIGHCKELFAGMSRSPAPPGPNYAGRERARKNKTSKWLIKRIKQPHGAATTTHHWMSARS
jgi:hypothetical protein